MNSASPQDSATAAHGQQVITCVAFIHKKINGVPSVLFAKRSLVKKFLPGALELPGGHIDFGEELEDGLRREIKEELHVDIRVGDPFGAFTYTNHIKGSHSLELAYFATLVDSEDSIQLNPDDHSEIVWISLDNINVLQEVNGPDDAELAIVRKGLRLLTDGNIDLGVE